MLDLIVSIFWADPKNGSHLMQILILRLCMSVAPTVRPEFSRAYIAWTTDSISGVRYSLFRANMSNNNNRAEGTFSFCSRVGADAGFENDLNLGRQAHQTKTRDCVSPCGHVVAQCFSCPAKCFLPSAPTCLHDLHYRHAPNWLESTLARSFEPAAERLGPLRNG